MAYPFPICYGKSDTRYCFAYTGCLKKNAWILLYQKNCCNIWTAWQIYKLPLSQKKTEIHICKFWIQNQLCTILGSQDIVICWCTRTKFSYFERLHIFGAYLNKKKIWKFLTSLHNKVTLMVNYGYSGSIRGQSGTVWGILRPP